MNTSVLEQAAKYTSEEQGKNVEGQNVFPGFLADLTRKLNRNAFASHFMYGTDKSYKWEEMLQVEKLRI